MAWIVYLCEGWIERNFQMRTRIHRLSLTAFGILALPIIGCAATTEQAPQHAQKSSSAASDRPIPLVHIAPKYPEEAFEQKIEGWVKLEFDLSGQGSVENPRIIDSKPEDVFDEAALTAIREWKYRQKWVDGELVARKGITVKLKFELDDNA